MYRCKCDLLGVPGLASPLRVYVTRVWEPAVLKRKHKLVVISSSLDLISFSTLINKISNHCTGALLLEQCIKLFHLLKCCILGKRLIPVFLIPVNEKKYSYLTFVPKKKQKIKKPWSTGYF